MATPGGTIFVLETTDQEVRVFDRSGKFLRLAARKGHGPGELDYGTGMAVAADLVWINDPGNGRFSAYSFDGKFVRQLLIESNGYGDVWSGVIDDSGRIVDLPVRIPTGGVDPRTKYAITRDHIRRIRSDGNADTVIAPSCAPPTFVFKARQGYITSVTVPFAPSEQVVVTSRGTSWCSPADQYRLLTGRIGDSLVEVVRRDVTPFR